MMNQSQVEKLGTLLDNLAESLKAPGRLGQSFDALFGAVALGQEQGLAGELEEYLIEQIKSLEDKIPNSTSREEERLQVGINALGGVLDELRRLQEVGFEGGNK